MSLKPPDLHSEEKHPIAAGLMALAVVVVALAVVVGVFVLVAGNVFGLGGSKKNVLAEDDGQSLYLPTPSPTKSQTGALITLSPAAGETDEPSESAEVVTDTPTPETPQITLSAGETTVGSMGRIDLTGVYTGGEGAVLQVQRKEGGKWTDFPVTTGVSGDQFSTYVQTGRSGAQKWRVVDSDTGLASNVVTVSVG